MRAWICYGILPGQHTGEHLAEFQEILTNERKETFRRILKDGHIIEFKVEGVTIDVSEDSYRNAADGEPVDPDQLDLTP